MAKLIYSMLTSLDGYVADSTGNFDWAAPSEEVHAFINGLEQNTGTYLLGRRMYEVLALWDTMPADTPSTAVNEYGKIWRAARKIVYSSTLVKPTTTNTVIEREFNAKGIQRLKSQAGNDLVIGGPYLTAQAIRAGLVDEIYQFIAPVIIGGGNYWLPLNTRIKLKLVDLKKFEESPQVTGEGNSSFVFLHYQLR